MGYSLEMTRDGYDNQWTIAEWEDEPTAAQLVEFILQWTCPSEISDNDLKLLPVEAIIALRGDRVHCNALNAEIFVSRY